MAPTKMITLITSPVDRFSKFSEQQVTIHLRNSLGLMENFIILSKYTPIRTNTERKEYPHIKVKIIRSDQASRFLARECFLEGRKCGNCNGVCGT